METQNSIPIPNPIAERRLSIVGDPGKTVIVRIGTPAPDPRGDWICPVHIEGIDESLQQCGRGIDSMQALINAFEAARHALDGSGLSLTWEGGEPGDHGFPRVVPYAFGRAFASTIEAHIDKELENLAQPPAPSAHSP